MKNMKISKKLMLSYLIVTIFCVIVGGTGIFGMSEINRAADDMYERQTKPLPDLAKSLEFIQRLRIQFRNVILFSHDHERLDLIQEEINDRTAKFEEYTESYSQTIASSDETKKELYRVAMAAYHESFKTALMQILSSARYGAELDTLLAIMDRTTPAANTIVDNFTECMNLNIETASHENDRNTTLFYTMIGAISIVIVISVLFSLFFAKVISGVISVPVIALTELMKTAASTGDIDLSEEDLENIHKLSERKDEIGECIVSTVDFLSHMIEVSKILGIIADGDLTPEIDTLSEKDTIGISLIKMLESLNNMFGEINAASDQVTEGSRQIADGAQRLSHASSMQASTVDELTASISEIAENTHKNADIASHTATLAKTIIENAEKGNEHMNDMISAVEEINQASQDIKRVIKVIEDIAFQTNILALNAAVEAARAGDHGKGFSVVAEEVRNLASKSALAAKDTGKLIANSIKKAELGVSIAAMTGESLDEIMNGIKESDRLILQIATSSELQSKGIEEINNGIQEVSKVVQQNSATAEESAAASEEMSTQSNILKDLISKFKIISC